LLGSGEIFGSVDVEKEKVGVGECAELLRAYKCDLVLEAHQEMARGIIASGNPGTHGREDVAVVGGTEGVAAAASKRHSSQKAGAAAGEIREKGWRNKWKVAGKDNGEGEGCSLDASEDASDGAADAWEIWYVTAGGRQPLRYLAWDDDLVAYGTESRGSSVEEILPAENKLSFGAAHSAGLAAT
jgi:hypothetical protein